MSSADSIFISYRRGETSGAARALFERLRHRCRQPVFMDLEGIAVGDKFADVLEQQLDRCGVLLALIGPDWLGTNAATGRRRIDDSGDFVRIEVARALARGIRVVPVLVGKAQMPAAEDLPLDLRGLRGRHWMELDLQQFDADVGHLIGALETLAAREAVAAPGRSESPGASAPHITLRRAVAALGVLAIIGAAALVWSFTGSRQPAARAEDRTVMAPAATAPQAGGGGSGSTVVATPLTAGSAPASLQLSPTLRQSLAALAVPDIAGTYRLATSDSRDADGTPGRVLLKGKLVIERQSAAAFSYYEALTVKGVRTFPESDFYEWSDGRFFRVSYPLHFKPSRYAVDLTLRDGTLTRKVKGSNFSEETVWTRVADNASWDRWLEDAIADARAQRQKFSAR